MSLIQIMSPNWQLSAVEMNRCQFLAIVTSPGIVINTGNVTAVGDGI